MKRHIIYLWGFQKLVLNYGYWFNIRDSELKLPWYFELWTKKKTAVRRGHRLYLLNYTVTNKWCPRNGFHLAHHIIKVCSYMRVMRITSHKGIRYCTGNVVRYHFGTSTSKTWLWATKQIEPLNALNICAVYVDFDHKRTLKGDEHRVNLLLVMCCIFILRSSVD